jgi:hypothetical protein
VPACRVGTAGDAARAGRAMVGHLPTVRRSLRTSLPDTGPGLPALHQLAVPDPVRTPVRAGVCSCSYRKTCPSFQRGPRAPRNFLVSETNSRCWMLSPWDRPLCHTNSRALGTRRSLRFDAHPSTPHRRVPACRRPCTPQDMKAWTVSTYNCVREGQLVFASGADGDDHASEQQHTCGEATHQQRALGLPHSRTGSFRALNSWCRCECRRLSFGGTAAGRALHRIQTLCAPLAAQ